METRDTAMSQSKKWLYRQRWALLGAAMGAVLFVALYGVSVLDPTNTGWLVNGGGDPAQHQLGWELFRQSPWKFPYIGMNYHILYPHRISMLYTDSLPLFALLFKLLDPVLPEPFQYFGWWGLLCFALQGAFGQKLVAATGGVRPEQTARNVATLPGTMLILLFPALTIRMFGHTALAGNWLILMALYLFFSADRVMASTRRACLWWGLMGILGASFHMYYLPMLGIVAVGFAVRRISQTRRPLTGLLPVFSYCGTALAFLLLLGAFSGNFSGASANVLYGADLLGMFFEQYNVSFEGNVYIGLGNTLACALAAAAVLWLIFAKKDSAWKQKAARWAPSCLVMVLLSVAAGASSTIGVAGAELFKVPVPQILLSLWSMFSSCARITWLAGYLLVAVACGVLLRLDNLRVSAAALAVCVACQAAGQWDLLSTVQAWMRPRVSMERQEPEPEWNDIAALGTIQHLAFVSPADLGSDAFWEASRAASKYHWTLNTFYVAHVDGNLLNETIKGTLDSGLEPDTLYLFQKSDMLRSGAYPLNYYQVGHWTVGSVNELPLDPIQTQELWEMPLSDLEPAEDTVLFTGQEICLQEGQSVSSKPRTLFPGRYQVTLEGSDINKTYVYALNNRELRYPENIDVVFTESSPDTLRFQFYLYEIVGYWEVAIHALEQPVTISSITVERIEY